MKIVNSQSFVVFHSMCLDSVKFGNHRKPNVLTQNIHFAVVAVVYRKGAAASLALP